MPEREPAEVTNLDRYGYPELPWSRSRDILAARYTRRDHPCFPGTTRPDGRPHAAGIGARWHVGDVYSTSGPGTRNSRNLVENPASTISMSLEGIDLVLEGVASRVTDRPTLETVAALYRDGGCRRR